MTTCTEILWALETYMPRFSELSTSVKRQMAESVLITDFILEIVRCHPDLLAQMKKEIETLAATVKKEEKRDRSITAEAAVKRKRESESKDAPAAKKFRLGPCPTREEAPVSNRQSSTITNVSAVQPAGTPNAGSVLTLMESVEANLADDSDVATSGGSFQPAESANSPVCVQTVVPFIPASRAMIVSEKAGEKVSEKAVTIQQTSKMDIGETVVNASAIQRFATMDIASNVQETPRNLLATLNLLPPLETALVTDPNAYKSLMELGLNNQRKWALDRVAKDSGVENVVLTRSGHYDAKEKHEEVIRGASKMKPLVIVQVVCRWLRNRLRTCQDGKANTVDLPDWSKMSPLEIVSRLKVFVDGSAVMKCHKAYGAIYFYNLINSMMSEAKVKLHTSKQNREVSYHVYLEHFVKDMRVADDERKTLQRTLDGLYRTGANWMDIIKDFEGPGIVILIIKAGLSPCKVASKWNDKQREAFRVVSQYMPRVKSIVKALEFNALEELCKERCLPLERIEAIEALPATW